MSSITNAVEPWATYRGNMQRTGNTDGIGGPAAPKILWAIPSKDHYIAAPVPAGDRLLVSGLGAFNVGQFACLSIDPKISERLLWSKTTPALKLPSVSSPAILKDKLYFGDGMHQTNGATLYCLDLVKGGTVWQHPVPGNLVHLEGAPTIEVGKVYIGGGAAGVLCVDMHALSLEGKTLDPAGVEKALAQRWKELQAKYEIDRKKDPDFAIPPNEEQLPKPNPKRVWQQGKDKWHVDAPVAFAQGKILVASAFLDKEQIGDRALYCLDAKSGDVLWRKPLPLNPWGGPSVEGDTIVLSGSSIGYYPNALKGARGMIAAFDLKSGAEKWQKEIPAGVVGCAALADGAAIVTATDGKIRAFNLADGERRWIYDSKVPYFAPAAIAKGVVYAGDFKGAIHAVDLKSGGKQWILDLGTEPATKSPGMVYGGPIVHGGKIYVATCNLEGPFARQPTVVVCIGEK
ncbi:MAG: PQQ-binding-like beta-propeller repeat protein [Gemmataceae bacterium]|nr:PQQ-binding-like beta-propeller repeat protein [Gemmataceae bacterium]MCI0737859.1 PQQ-binding-like beta-propeller repeat protein [Gemmataceae bacterium]